MSKQTIVLLVGVPIALAAMAWMGWMMLRAILG